jgi:hypothetical protein
MPNKLRIIALKPSGNYMPQISYQSVTLCFVFTGSVQFSL